MGRALGSEVGVRVGVGVGVRVRVGVGGRGRGRTNHQKGVERGKGRQWMGRDKWSKTNLCFFSYSFSYFCRFSLEFCRYPVS